MTSDCNTSPPRSWHKAPQHSMFWGARYLVHMRGSANGGSGRVDGVKGDVAQRQQVKRATVNQGHRGQQRRARRAAKFSTRGSASSRRSASSPRRRSPRGRRGGKLRPRIGITRSACGRGRGTRAQPPRRPHQQRPRTAQRATRCVDEAGEQGRSPPGVPISSDQDGPAGSAVCGRGRGTRAQPPRRPHQQRPRTAHRATCC
jgi:hypothetical protein